MPSFFALLRMAELDQVFGAPFVHSWQQSGLFGTLAILALLGSAGALAAGMAKHRRRLLQVAITVALVGSWFGWVGAFFGYVGACRVAGAATTAPKESELIEGANAMAWTALVPTAVALPLLLIAGVGLALHPRREREAAE